MCVLSDLKDGDKIYNTSIKEIIFLGELVTSHTFTSARRSTLAIAGLIGMSVALYGAPAHAQQSEVDVLRQQITELQLRLDKLEAAKIDVKAVTPTVASASKTPVTFSGLLQVQGLYGLSGDQLGLAGNNKDTLRIRRGEIRITAPNITNNLAATAMLDLAKTTANGTASNGTTIGTERNAVLQEVMLTWQAQKAANYNTFVDVGQYKVPFGYEGDLVSSGALQLVERALFFRGNGTAAGGSNIRLGGDQRELGARVRGNIGEFDYQIGAFQGLGERQNASGGDLDSQTAVAARLIYKPKSIEGLQVGASYATGGLSGNNLGAPFAFVAAPGVTAASVDRKLANAFVAYKKDKITAQAEYFDIKLEGQEGTSGTEVKGNAYYGSLGYLFKPQLEGVLRYDQYEANKDSAVDSTTKEATIGLNYYVKGNNAKVQANIVRVERPDTSTTLDPKSTELRVQFQLGF